MATPAVLLRGDTAARVTKVLSVGPPPDLGGGGGGGFGSSTGRIHGDSNVHVLPDDADAILYRLVVRKLADIFVEKKLESLVTASAATC